MIDWNALSPHRPLDAGDDRYAKRPDGGGERLAQLLRAGGRPVVVVGPAGCGKTTEMAQAAEALSWGSMVHLVHLDRVLNMRKADEAQVIGCLHRELGGDPLTDPLSKDNLRNRLRVLRRIRHVVLLIDGLEKAPLAQAAVIVKSLLDIADEATLAMVSSPALVIGPSAYEIVSNVRIFALRALVYWQPYTSPRALWASLFGQAPLDTLLPDALNFFLNMFVQRVKPQSALPREVIKILLLAAAASGGMPRVFLQLLQDAATYAALAGEDIPSLLHLQAAIQDQADSLGLLLQDGDAKALAEASGTNGLEVPLERKLRFFAHGLLLEYEENGERLVFPSPLLYKFFGRYLS